jgi:hypothetical protein
MHSKDEQYSEQQQNEDIKTLHLLCHELPMKE